jgi:hypothetical protein
LLYRPISKYHGAKPDRFFASDLQQRVQSLTNRIVSGDVEDPAHF